VSSRLVTPSGPVEGQFRVPGSKSIANRALICAAVAPGVSEIRNPGDAEDVALLVNGLNQMGILVRRDGDDLIVEGKGGVLHAPKFPIPVKNAGTTFRFLLALSTVARGRTSFDVSERMAERPVDELLDALRQLGATVGRTPAHTLFEAHGPTLRGGVTRLSASRSSQFLSAILLAAPCAAGAVTIEVDGPAVSGPYVAMTLDVMRAFGVEVGLPREGRFEVPAGGYRPASFRVEPDASGASYGFAAAAVTGGSVCVPGFRRGGVQADAGFVEVIESMGCEIRETPAGLCVTGPAVLRGVNVDLNESPDIVPTVVAICLLASEPSTIRNVGHLRYKESNRLEGLAGELRSLGADIAIEGAGMRIVPAPLHGGELDPHDDHRLAMSFALVGLKTPGVSISNPDCVAKSFPGFWREFMALVRPAG
jgi:3-phosphoshikimate 1-carboxyvinyltransferase